MIRQIRYWIATHREIAIGVLLGFSFLLLAYLFREVLAVLIFLVIIIGIVVAAYFDNKDKNDDNH